MVLSKRHCRRTHNFTRFYCSWLITRIQRTTLPSKRRQSENRGRFYDSSRPSYGVGGFATNLTNSPTAIVSPAPTLTAIATTVEVEKSPSKYPCGGGGTKGTLYVTHGKSYFLGHPAGADWPGHSKTGSVPFAVVGPLITTACMLFEKSV